MAKPKPDSDELNWEMVHPAKVYPVSNACGQRGLSYSSPPPPNVCPPGDEVYQCPADPRMDITSASESTFPGDHPPPLRCFPRTADQTMTGYYDPMLDFPRARGKLVPGGRGAERVVPNTAGQTDVEGCCWWGRGALHTRGVCGLGKLHHFLGAGAGAGARYPDVDFCRDPEAICSDARTREMRWTVALFEWVERVQSYAGDDWNYMDGLREFAAERDPLGTLQFSAGTDEPLHFIDAVGGVLEQGCPAPPCHSSKPLRLRWKGRRKKSFAAAVEALGLPVKSISFRRVEEHFLDPETRANFEEKLLMSKSPAEGGEMYQSYRYHFTDFLESLQKMVDVGFDCNFFYVGQSLPGGGNGNGGTGSFSSGIPLAGILNIAIFLSYAIEMSVLDDACDEHNTQLVNGRFPVSNACGMYGASYQDIVCNGKDEGMECPLDTGQSFSAVTRTLDHRAPQPFKCAPKSKYPVTGFWDEAHLEENHQTAFANQVGRIDVEGCCWWGRGVLRKVTQGRCFFGQLNYHIGKRAASEGRPSMYPDTDFCEFPEAVCASKHSNELRWVVGMFYWIQQVQSFDNQDGWNYIKKIEELADKNLSNSVADKSLLISVDCILKTGSVDCDSEENLTDRLEEILGLITRLDLPTHSPTTTVSPSVVPTEVPTVHPTKNPSISPTSTNSPSASPNAYSWPTRRDVDYIINILKESRTLITSNLLSPRAGRSKQDKLYSFDEFLSALTLFANGSVQEMYFFIGHNTAINAMNLKRGLINVAAFLAHSKTLAIYDSICDEQNVDSVENKFPLSNSCGQYGVSYQNLRCAPDESHMECSPDPNLQMSAVSGFDDGESGPPPFFCGPRRYFPFTGYYDAGSDEVRNDEPFASQIGRTDVQSCCWWGRGAAQVKGVCMYGKLNYHIGARAKEEGRRSLFPDVDFCKDPQAICSGQYSYSLMWGTAMLSWVELIQSHQTYSDSLEKYGYGDIEDEEFIDVISDILDSGDVERLARRINFKFAIEALTI